MLFHRIKAVKNWVVKEDKTGRLFMKRGKSAKRILANLGDPKGLKYSVMGTTRTALKYLVLR